MYNRASIISNAMICGTIVTICIFIQATNAKHKCFDVSSNVNLSRVVRQNACGVSKTRQSHLLDRIMGGTNAGLGEFPWMARLFYRYGSDKDFNCGGSLIHKKYVLTAAHCCYGTLNMELLSVRLGEYDTLTDRDCYRGHCAPKHVDVKVDRIYSHEEYNANELTNDICLLKLQKEVKLSDYIYPVCLPVDCKMQAYKYDHTKFTAAGWGAKDEIHGRTVDILQKVNITAVPMRKCNKLWQEENITVGANQICAGREVGQDVCGGDSGGPLMYKSAISGRARQYLVGLVSFGQPCSHRVNTLVPGVYTNVASYLPWIFNHIEHS